MFRQFEHDIQSLQENIRIASDYFNRYLRVADYWGGASGVDVAVLAGGIWLVVDDDNDDPVSP